MSLFNSLSEVYGLILYVMVVAHLYMLLPLPFFIEFSPPDSCPCVILLVFLLAVAIVDAVALRVWLVPL